jgi:predicted DNA binding protein
MAGAGEARVGRAALAADLGVAETTVRNAALRAGIRAPASGYTPEQAEAIRAVFRERRGRVLARALAAELGVSRATILSHARRLGIGWARGCTPAQADAIRASVKASRQVSRRVS